MKQFWLVKSEPEVFSIDDLEKHGVTGWEGVRNYTARNFMRDSMKEGDLVIFYHSNAEPPGIAGLAKVHGAPIADPTQFQKKNEYYDATSPPDDPRWMMRQFSFVERFPKFLPLEVLKADKTLVGMPLLQKGQRLSVQQVSEPHFKRVLTLAGAKSKA